MDALSRSDIFYLRTLQQEYRRLSRLRRWMLRRTHPFLEIAVRHLAEIPLDPPESAPARHTPSEESTR